MRSTEYEPCRDAHPGSCSYSRKVSKCKRVYFMHKNWQNISGIQCHRSGINLCHLSKSFWCARPLVMQS